MGFPTTAITTANLDSGTDDPSLARADLLTCVENMNTLVDGAGDALGACVLNSVGTIGNTQVPSTMNPTGVLTLAPDDGKVKIQDVLRMQVLTTANVNALTSNAEGDVVYVSDGDAGSPCLAVYNGTNWLRLSLGATISTT